MARRDLQQLARHIHREEGDAIAGEAIIAQARKVNKTFVVAGTSSHKIHETVLRSNVLCVIDKPFRLREEAFRLRGE